MAKPKRSSSSSMADPMSVHYFSSGSDHDGEVSSASASASASVGGRDLSDLVRSFIEDDDGAAEIITTHQPEKLNHHFCLSDSDEECSINPRSTDLENILIRDSNNVGDDSFLLILRSHVSKALDSSRFLFRANNNIIINNNSSRSVQRRTVTAYLRDCGFNAGICKSRWESSGGLAAGNYEYIDVVHRSSISSNPSSSTMMIRYIVDLDFAGEFEIARPTAHYSSLIQLLPRVYVGRSEEMKKIVRLVCDEAKKSLKSGDLTLPPWRKNRYMQTKWFGPYRRAVNQTASSSPSVKSSDRCSVKCLHVGFNDVTNRPNGDGRFALPATTRTR